jgi:hypothetical protein
MPVRAYVKLANWRKCSPQEKSGNDDVRSQPSLPQDSHRTFAGKLIRDAALKVS